MTPSSLRPLGRRVAPGALLSLLLLAGCADAPTAPGPDRRPALVTTSSAGGVVVSQVYGGGGNTGATYTHDFIELYNAGTAAQSLAGWSVQYASSAGTSWSVTALSGAIQPGGYYLIRQAAGAGGTTPLPTPDATGNTAMSATSGKVALVNATAGLTGSGCPFATSVVDFVGYGSAANCFEGAGPTATLSNTTAALRKGNGSQDTNDNAADFATGAPTPRNSAVGPPAVASTVPANGATDVPVSASITVTFNKPVTVTGSWFTISCVTSGGHTATVSGGPTSFTLDPDADFAGSESCTVTVVAAQVADQANPSVLMAADASWSFTTVAVDPCTQPFTPTYAIQGSGLVTPLANQVVTTQGVVVGDYEGPSPTLRGFYLQDLTGDGDPATSDGLFVFNGNNDNVSLGDVVRVTGTAQEFQDQTQLGSVSAVTVCGTGSVAPVDVTLPVASATFLERYEGMLVRLPQTLYVTEHFQLGRFGQVVMSSSDRLFQPTALFTPGGAAAALQAANDLNRIIVDDARNDQNPDPILFGLGGIPLSASNSLRGGDAATGIVGVLTYTWAGNAASGNAYRVRPVGALGGGVPSFTSLNPRPATAPAVGGTLRVAGMNLLNWFNTFTGCTNGVGGAAASCRGAENVTELERQAAKTVAAIVALDADVLGLVELENDGYGPQSAIADLVNRVNAVAGAGTYAFLDVDALTGQVNALGTDGIRVGLIYKPSKVTPNGTTAVLNGVAFVNGGDGVARNRPALAQAFLQPDKGRLVVAVNHLKSKGSACDLPDAGDGQGNCNAVRTSAAQQLAAWLAADPTQTGETDALILGDLNAYAKEDPVQALVGAGFADLIAAQLGTGAYSYVFDGQWGYIDHALASSSLVPQVTGVAEWHVNADEPSVLDYNTNFKSAGQVASLYAPDQYRVADHDPVLVGLSLLPPAQVYAFTGLFAPIANPPAVNTPKAGAAVPIQFSLGGSFGTGVFVSGFPATRPMTCGATGSTSALVPTQTAGASGLTYDPATDTYTYPWKTEKGWAGTCRELVVRLADGTEQRAWFGFR